MRVLAGYNVVLKGASFWTFHNASYCNLYFNDNYGVNLISSSLGFRIIKLKKHA